MLKHLSASLAALRARRARRRWEQTQPHLTELTLQGLGQACAMGLLMPPPEYFISSRDAR